jgi:sec-independent protein translocase protein TatC
MGDVTKKNKLADSTMSLGDHLEELRMRLIYALAGLAVGLIVCLCIGKHIIAFMEKPYLDVVKKNSQQIITDANEMVADGNSVAKADTANSGDNEMDSAIKLQTLAPADGFVSYVKISAVAGLMFTSPWVFYHLWMFVAAGLYPNEKKYVYYAAPFSAILFVAGALFFILVVAPLTLNFLISFNKNFLGVKSQFTFQYYISFITHLMLVFGLAFQTPTAIFFLNRTGLVSIEALNNSRKYVFLAIFVVAAMATPPDVISQVTLAIPLYILFELGILVSYIAERRAKAAEKAAS